MNYEKKYQALKYNKNFSKLNVEFLIFSLARNVEYIFLVLQGLSLLGLASFRVSTRYLPNLALRSEWANFAGHSYNPIWLYYHFLDVLFQVVKGLLTQFVSTLKTNLVLALILCFLIVSIWMAYKNMKYGYSRSESKRHNLISKTFKNALFEATLIERALWMMLFIDFIGFILIPERSHVLFLLVIYLLIVSVKYTHILSNAVIGLTRIFHKRLLQNKYVHATVVALDVLLIYLDSGKVFTLFALIFLYCLIAQLVFMAVRDSRQLLKASKYVFNVAVILLFAGLAGIYFISYAVVHVTLLPFHAYKYHKKRKFLSPVAAEYLNMAILAGLLTYYFRVIQRFF